MVMRNRKQIHLIAIIGNAKNNFERPGIFIILNIVYNRIEHDEYSREQ